MVAVVHCRGEDTCIEPKQDPEDCGYHCSNTDYHSDFQLPYQV